MLYRPQIVKIGDQASSSIIISTGTPQGCPISPKLYSLFTFDCFAKQPGNIVTKFADDTTVTGLISNNDETNYRHEIDDISTWCRDNSQHLNVSKTQEMIVDFRRNKVPLDPVIINDTIVEQVSIAKFLGIFFIQ